MKKSKTQFKIKNLIQSALEEDVGTGDITSNLIISAASKSSAKIVVKEPGIICGLDVAGQVFKAIDKRIVFIKRVRDGASVKTGKVIAVVAGPSRGILTAERTALNFLQRLSGIATLTNKFVKKVISNRVKILDTRKTTPGLRILEKYAVKIGGGTNHRFGLYDGILIKDNHITVVGSLRNTVRRAKMKNNKVEVEAKSLAQVREAIESGATRILLDNMGIAGLKKSIDLIRKSRKSIEIEISGGITLNNISKTASLGADFISIGALTHSAPALDISLEV